MKIFFIRSEKNICSLFAAVFLILTVSLQATAQDLNPIPLSFSDTSFQSVSAPAESVIAFSGETGSIQRVSFGTTNTLFVRREGLMYVAVPSNPASTLTIRRPDGKFRNYAFSKVPSSFPEQYRSDFSSVLVRDEDMLNVRQEAVGPAILRGDIDGDLNITSRDLILAKQVMDGQVPLANIRCAPAVDVDDDGAISAAEYQTLFILGLEARKNSFFMLPSDRNCRAFNAPFLTNLEIAAGLPGKLYLFQDLRAGSSLDFKAEMPVQVAQSSSQSGYIRIEPRSGLTELTQIPVHATLAGRNYQLSFHYSFYYTPPAEVSF